MRFWCLLFLVLGAAAQGQKTVEVQLLPNPPYTVVAGDTPPVGFLPDLFDAMKIPGYRWDLQVRPWARALSSTRDDKSGLVLLPTLSRTPERERSFVWVAPLNSPRYYFLGKSIAPGLTLADLKSKTIVVLLGNVADDWLHRNQFKDIVEVSALDQMVKMVAAGRADFLLKDITSLPFFLKSNGLTPNEFVLGPEVTELAIPLYFAGGPGFDPVLAKKIADELARLRQNGTVERLWNKWQ